MDKLLENLLPLVGLALFAIISGWLKKRTGEGAPSLPAPSVPEPGHPAGPARPPAPAPTDWEAELRRLFEGDETPAAPPPVPRPVHLPPVPPPVHRPAHAPASRPAPVSAKPITVVLPAVEARLDQAAAAYDRAHRLGDHVAAFMHSSRAEAKAPPPRGMKPATEEGRQAAGLLRQPQTLRQSMIVSLILSPPKGLE